MEDKTKGPCVHFLFNLLLQILIKDNTLFKLGSEVIHCFFHTQKLFLDIICNQQWLPDAQTIVADEQIFYVESSQTLVFKLRCEFLHALYKVIKKCNCILFIQRLTHLASIIKILCQGSLIRYLSEYLNSFRILVILQIFKKRILFLCFLGIVQDVYELIVKVIFVPILYQAYILKSAYTMARMKSQAILLIKRPLLFSSSLKNNELRICNNIG